MNEEKPDIKSAESNDASRSTFDLEPNPFEQSFARKANGGGAGSGAPPGSVVQGQTMVTPGGRRHILPPVASIASPSSLLPVPTTPGAGWAGSLRSGPLSPAMLQGPQNAPPSGGPGATNSANGMFMMRGTGDLLGRTGLTPGGSGSMFPNPGPATAAILGLTADFNGQPPSLQGPPTGKGGIPSAGAGTSAGTGAGAGAGPGIQPPTSAATGGPTSAVNTTGSSAAATPGRGPAGAGPAGGPGAGPGANGANSGAGPGAQQQQSDQADAAANGLFMLSQAPPSRRGSGGRHEGDGKQSGADDAASSRAASVPQNDDKPGSRAGRRTATPKRKAASVKNEPAGESDDSETSGRGGTNGNASKKSNGSKKAKTSHDSTEEDKRKSFLERNRIAALKCRQRKKQWLEDLKTKAEFYAQENQTLTNEVTMLREQVMSLKSVLMAHKDCNVGLPPELLNEFQSGAVAPAAGAPPPVAVPAGVQVPLTADNSGSAAISVPPRGTIPATATGPPQPGYRPVAPGAAW